MVDKNRLVATAVAPEDRFGMSQPTLSWIRDDGIVDIYVEGLTDAQFKELNGLSITNTGLFDVGKRLSRVYRPYHVTQYSKEDKVDDPHKKSVACLNLDSR